MRFLSGQIPGDRKKSVEYEGCQGLEAGGNGSYLTGTEFQFCQMKIWWMAGGDGSVAMSMYFMSLKLDLKLVKKMKLRYFTTI